MKCFFETRSSCVIGIFQANRSSLVEFRGTEAIIGRDRDDGASANPCNQLYCE